jgi:hypothetical protein
MSKTNYANKKIWLVTSDKYNFTIIGNTAKECKELIDEMSEESITEKLKYQEIGNMCPTMQIYNNWEGESFIITTNFYNL